MTFAFMDIIYQIDKFLTENSRDGMDITDWLILVFFRLVLYEKK